MQELRLIILWRGPAVSAQFFPSIGFEQMSSQEYSPSDSIDYGKTSALTHH
jgi:hypothetical protein